MWCVSMCFVNLNFHFRLIMTYFLMLGENWSKWIIVPSFNGCRFFETKKNMCLRGPSHCRKPSHYQGNEGRNSMIQKKMKWKSHLQIYQTPRRQNNSATLSLRESECSLNPFRLCHNEVIEYFKYKSLKKVNWCLLHLARPSHNLFL